jgi:thiamine biosynthesis lipoprotein
MRLVLLGFIFSFLISCDSEPQLVELAGEALGTGYRVQFYSSERFEVVKKFDSTIAAINKSMSTYLEDSDISKINDGDTTIVIEPMFRDVLALSRKIYNATDGYFDPTVGILVNAYGFGPEKQIKVLDSVVLDSLRAYVGLDKIKLSREGRIIKENKAVYLDFNSIAKGYSIDRLGKMLENYGVENYLIELGGELFAKGKNLDKNQTWRVGIENIDSPLNNREFTEAVELQNRGMAGSGNYRKFRIDSTTGKRYVHTINPLTGKAEKSDILSATVIATTCAEADGFATAFMALGLEKSKQVLNRHQDIEAYFIYADKDSTAIFKSKGFSNFIVK